MKPPTMDSLNATASDTMRVVGILGLSREHKSAHNDEVSLVVARIHAKLQATKTDVDRTACLTEGIKRLRSIATGLIVSHIRSLVLRVTAIEKRRGSAVNQAALYLSEKLQDAEQQAISLSQSLSNTNASVADLFEPVITDCTGIQATIEQLEEGRAQSRSWGSPRHHAMGAIIAFVIGLALIPVGWMITSTMSHPTASESSSTRAADPQAQPHR